MSSAKRILIVDDEKDLRELLKLCLEEAGYEVFVAGDGEEGLKVAQAVVPDLIISDVLMPKLSGSEFFKKLRETYFGRRIPFIVMTARGKMRDYFELAGANGFIEKPISGEMLLEKVKELFEKAEEHTSQAVPKRVLVVSRYESCAQEMIQLLQAENCHTDFVITGEQVVSKAVMFLPNIIIIESRMMDMGPNTIIRIFRQMMQFKKIPILVYNYYHPSEVKGEALDQKDLAMTFFVNACLEEGATEYIGHYDAHSFIEKVNKYLHQGFIVVVDDDAGMTLMLKKRLESEGYYVSAAPNAKAGLELIHRVKPNLVILDVVMPEVNGYELLGVLKDDPEAKNIPVIMLTMKGSDSEIKKGLDLGADDYIVKPCNIDLLVRRIKTLLKKA